MDKVRHKITSNKVKTLPQASKEIILKSVVKALPTYSMGVFKLPCSLFKNINRIMQNYWWGQQEQERKIH